MDRKRLFKLGFSLFLICAISAACLSALNTFTEPIIAENRAKAEMEAMGKVLSGTEEFEGIGEDISVGRKGADIVGYVVTVHPSGYNGRLTLIVGLDTSFNVTGMEITEHSETPGLGSKADSPEFLEQFSGLGEDIMIVKSQKKKDNEAVAISGATITSEAIAEGVRQAIIKAKEMGGGK